MDRDNLMDLSESVFIELSDIIWDLWLLVLSYLL